MTDRKLSLGEGAKADQDFGPSWRKYWKAEQAYEAAVEEGNEEVAEWFEFIMWIASKEVEALGGKIPFVLAVHPSKVGTITPTMQRAREQLAYFGAWPIPE